MPNPNTNRKTDKTDAFIVRPDTKASLGLLNNPDLLNAITHAGEKFINLDRSTASRMAFELIYKGNNPNHVMHADLSKLGFTLQNSSPNLYLITPSQATIIGHELVYQYRARHPDFLSLHMTEGCETEHAELSRAIGNEPVLLFRIYMAVNLAKKRSVREVEKICQLLQSENEKNRRQGIDAFCDVPFYRQVMLPYASHIGKLLLAIHQQRIAYQTFVVPEPVVKSYLPVEHNVPQALLDEVPALKKAAPFIRLRDTLKAFCKDNADTLKNIRSLMKVGVDFQAFLAIPTDMRSGIITMKLSDQFTSQLHEIAENIGGEEVDLNKFIVCIEHATSLLEAYTEMKNAHDVKMQAESNFHTAHQKVQNYTSATETMLTDTTALAKAIQKVLSANADLHSKIESFQGVVAEHFQF